MSVYLHLFHGRTDPDQDMDDWGTDGPVIGPLHYVHCTYMCDIKLAADFEVFTKWFPDQPCCDNGYPCDGDLAVVDGLVCYDGVYYGDWSVSTSPTGCPSSSTQVVQLRR